MKDETSSYVALLRGINVGGNHPVRMQDLQNVLAGIGATDVITYIQSGNVIFRHGEADSVHLSGIIEQALRRRFGFDIPTVVVTATQLRQVIAEAPDGFGRESDRYRYDVLFVKPPMTVNTVMEAVPVNPDVDRKTAGPGVVYFSRLTALASRSRLSRIVGTPVYRFVTIRNWNTTTKLLSLTGLSLPYSEH